MSQFLSWFYHGFTIAFTVALPLTPTGPCRCLYHGSFSYPSFAFTATCPWFYRCPSFLLLLPLPYRCFCSCSAFSADSRFIIIVLFLGLFTPFLPLLRLVRSFKPTNAFRIYYILRRFLYLQRIPRNSTMSTGICLCTVLTHFSSPLPFCAILRCRPLSVYLLF